MLHLKEQMGPANDILQGVELDRPHRVGRYDVFLQIGAGGMARVFLAVQHGPFDANKLVVIKQLRERVTEDADALAMFVNEAQIALRLNHRNVVHTYEVVAEEPEYFLAMEFLDGQSLLQILKRIGREVMPLEAHLWILAQVLAGLHYAHELRDFKGNSIDIVHRDVSPSNVVVCYNGEVKLVDFGIAKALGGLSDTQDGVVKGKLGYAAPEQCVGKDSDRRADIYAVGVMLWEAMARKRRTTAETWPAMLHARLQNSDPPIEDIWPGAPPDLVEISRRALQQEPEHRYPNALAFQRDIERFLQRRGYKGGAAALSAFVAPHFEAERSRLHGIIDAYLARASRARAAEARATGADVTGTGVRSSSSAKIALSERRLVSLVDREQDHAAGEDATSAIPVDDVLLLASRLDLPPSEPRIPTAPDGVLVNDRASLTGEPVLALVPRAKRPRLWAWALLGAGLTGAAGFAFNFVRSGITPAPAAESTATATATVTAARAERAEESAHSSDITTSPALAPNEIEIRIAVTPEDASLELDGKRLNQNPYIGKAARDGKEHELRVSADQHRSIRRTLQFDINVDLQLDLEVVHGGGRSVRMVRRGKPEPVSPHPTAERAAAPQRSATPQVEPGMDLRPQGTDRIKRTIDEKDPYAP